MRHLSLAAALTLALTACTQPQAPATKPSADSPAPASSTSAPAPPVTDANTPPILPPGNESPMPSTGAPDGDRNLAHWNGYGDTKFGMDKAAFKKAWGGELKDGAEDPACFHLSPVGGKTTAELAFMFVEGKFARISSDSTALLAPGGGKRGMNIADIEKLYPGKIEVQPHKYTDGKYLRIKNGENALIFETNKAGTVKEWRVGRPPAIDYVEGCA